MTVDGLGCNEVVTLPRSRVPRFRTSYSDFARGGAISRSDTAVTPHPAGPAGARTQSDLGIDHALHDG